MEEKYRAEIEKKRAESVNRAWKIISVFVVVFQLIMLILMAAKPGGPFKTQRRTIYCILYLTLFLVTGIAMILNRNFWRREKKNYHLYLHAELVYAAFICFWGCCVTLNDQLGGNDLSVFTYMMLSVAAHGFLEPVKAGVIFMAAFVFLNICLPGIQTIENNIFSNIINSFSIAGISTAISYSLYRNKVIVTKQEVTIRKQYEEITRVNEILSHQAMVDELTDMNNRRYMEWFIGEKIKRLEEESGTISCMMLDIDYFKQFNDRYGHIAGDVCLKKIAEVIRECCQNNDVAAIRFGGEEFFICLFRWDRDEAVEMAETIREKIAECRFKINGEEEGSVTISIGVYTWHGEGRVQMDDLVCLSDKALYQAKKNGRNRVEVLP